ncbi:MAG: GGDEF domain-containing protein, partial [Eubacteriales bacterium]
LEFSVVMVDLNGLKSVNDQFGHPAGDEYICKVIEILKSKIRERDEICRIGGDEFIVLLRNCSERIASIKLNAVLVELTKCVSLFPMSISYGIEYVSEEKEVQADELLELVDDKMYAFKKAYKKSLKEAKI